MLRRTLYLAMATAAAFLLALPAYSQFASQHQGGPDYSMEGAWYGTATIPGVITTPTLDTFTADSQRPSARGTFLCTIPPAKVMNPVNPNGPLTTTASAHGNWVRIGKNKYAFTALRTIFDENGNLFGYSRNWGTITPISDDEYTGTVNTQYVLANGTPFTPVFTGVLHSHRVAIQSEQ